jgi:peroxiredoxin
MAKRYQTGTVIPDFNFTTPWGGEKKFYASSGGKKKVLFFLRYYGCRVTQLEFRNIIADYDKFRDKGAQVYVVLQSALETLRGQLKEEDIAFHVICDPEGSLYRLFDIGYLPLGYFLPNLPGNWPRPQKLEEKIAEATALGIVHGIYEGNEQQLPAVFIVDEKQKTLLAHYSQHIADIPDTRTLLKYL